MRILEYKYCRHVFLRIWYIVSSIIGSIFLIGFGLYFRYPSIIGFTISVVPLLIYMILYHSNVIKSRKTSVLINVVLALIYAILLLTVAFISFFNKRNEDSKSGSYFNFMLSIAAMIYLISVGLYLDFMIKSIRIIKDLKEEKVDAREIAWIELKYIEWKWNLYTIKQINSTISLILHEWKVLFQEKLFQSFKW